MDNIAKNSSKTLAGGGQVLSDDIPKDGTGMSFLAHSRGYLHTKSKHRGRQARSMAFAFPGLVEAPLLQGPGLDQDHQ